jgi:hypothetical protein
MADYLYIKMARGTGELGEAVLDVMDVDAVASKKRNRPGERAVS